MARIDETGAYGVDTNTEEGHEVYYHFKIFGILDTESVTITRNYETMCRELPTLWKIRVVFERDSSLRAVSCRLSVKRLDSSPIAVKISSTVIFSNYESQQLSRTLNIPMMIVIREQEVYGMVNPILTPMDIFDLHGRELKVRVYLNVTYCHRARPKYDPITNLTADVNQMSL